MIKGDYSKGGIQEFFIRGVQTLAQKGLLNFFEANYFSPTPPPTSRGCMHVIIPWPVTVYLNHWTEKWISLKFAHVQTKSKICTKVVNANFAHLFAPLCEGVCRFGICHLCADFTLSLHTFAHEQI